MKGIRKRSISPIENPKCLFGDSDEKFSHRNVIVNKKPSNVIERPIHLDVIRKKNILSLDKNYNTKSSEIVRNNNNFIKPRMMSNSPHSSVIITDDEEEVSSFETNDFYHINSARNRITDNTIKSYPNSFIDYKTLTVDDQFKMRKEFQGKLLEVIEINPSIKNVFDPLDRRIELERLGELVEHYYEKTVGANKKKIAKKKNKDSTIEKFRMCIFGIFCISELGINYLTNGKIDMKGFSVEEMKKLKKYNSLLSELYDEWYGKDGSGEGFKLSIEMKLVLIICLNIVLGIGSKFSERFLGNMAPYIKNIVSDYIEPSILASDINSEEIIEDGILTKGVEALGGLFNSAVKNTNINSHQSPKTPTTPVVRAKTPQFKRKSSPKVEESEEPQEK